MCQKILVDELQNPQTLLRSKLNYCLEENKKLKEQLQQVTQDYLIIKQINATLRQQNKSNEKDLILKFQAQNANLSKKIRNLRQENDKISYKLLLQRQLRQQEINQQKIVWEQYQKKIFQLRRSLQTKQLIIQDLQETYKKQQKKYISVNHDNIQLLNQNLALKNVITLLNKQLNYLKTNINQVTIRESSTKKPFSQIKEDSNIFIQKNKQNCLEKQKYSYYGLITQSNSKMQSLRSTQSSQNTKEQLRFSTYQKNVLYKHIMNIQLLKKQLKQQKHKYQDLQCMYEGLKQAYKDITIKYSQIKTQKYTQQNNTQSNCLLPTQRYKSKSQSGQQTIININTSDSSTINKEKDKQFSISLQQLYEQNIGTEQFIEISIISPKSLQKGSSLNKISSLLDLTVINQNVL